MKTIGETFECYSEPLYGFLLMKRIKPTKTFVHFRTKVRCYCFIVDEVLIAALEEWKHSKPSH